MSHGILKTVSLWARSKTNDLEIIFVTGAPRSGTSLLKNILTAHPALCGTDRESTGVFRFRNLAEFQLGELQHNIVQMKLDAARGLPSFYTAIAEEFMGRQDSKRFVDKINIASWRLHYLKRFFPKAKYVNIIRDGRDSFCSALKHPNVRQSNSVEGYARYWKKCVTLPIRLIPQKSLFTLRYEDLVSSPEHEIKRLMSWLGFPFEPGQIDVNVFSRTSSIGRRVQHHGNLLKPISDASVGKWKSQLSERDRKAFEKIGIAQLRDFGY